jgi:hypothetical protein
MNAPALLPHWTIIGFTGHRKLANPAVVTEALTNAIHRISLSRPRLAGISSAASGGDTLFAEEMVRRQCPISLILPFARERFQRDFQDDPTGWNRACTLMTKAIHLDVVQPLTRSAADADCTNAPNPPGAGATGSQRSDAEKIADNAAYMDAGYRTIDRADIVIAVWDRQPSRGFGGTSDAVTYARALGKALLIIDPETGRMTEERMDAIPPLPSHAAPDADVVEVIEPRARVERYFEHVNELAKHHGPRSRYLVRLCLQLLLLSSILGFANLIFHTSDAASWTFRGASTIALIAAFGLIILRGRAHERWMHARVQAEVCRSFLATWDIRRHATLSHHPRPAIPGLARLFSDLRLLREMDRAPLIEMDEARAKYHQERITDQIDYFATQHQKALHGLQRRRWGMNLCTLGALACTVLGLIMAIKKVGETRSSEWIEFLASILPLITTALGLTLITQEAARRAARYAEMKGTLVALQQRLLASNTWDALARIATEVEEELLQELVEWRSFVRFTRDIAHLG